MRVAVVLAGLVVAAALPALAATPAELAADDLNAAVLKTYRQAKAVRLAQTSPVIIVAFDQLVMIRSGHERRVDFTPRSYDDFKDMSHTVMGFYGAAALGMTAPTSDWAVEFRTLRERASAMLPQLAALGVEYCEQPLAAGDAGGAELKSRSPIPIYVDEDCHTLADVAACAERAHGINVKLAKSGGIREAIRMVHAARALELGCMLGCMIESGLGIAAGAHVASLFDHVDLDGNILLGQDPWPGVQFVDGVQVPAELPGLGVSARE